MPGAISSGVGAAESGSAALTNCAVARKTMEEIQATVCARLIIVEYDMFVEVGGICIMQRGDVNNSPG